MAFTTGRLSRPLRTTPPTFHKLAESRVHATQSGFTPIARLSRPAQASPSLLSKVEEGVGFAPTDELPRLRGSGSVQ